MFHKNRLKKPVLTIFFLSLLLATLHQFSVIQNILKFFHVVFKVVSEFKPDISKNVSDVRLLLWTRKDTEHGQEFTIDSLSKTDFNRSRPTKILIHGFADHGQTIFVKALKKKFLEKADLNVISVDWEPLAKSPWYTTARKNSKNVGQLAGNLINDLVNQGSSFEDFHILGASLGAHVAGYAGFYTKGQVGRITGLDPSGPLFHSVPNPEKLDPTDAQFVDIIHTAGRWVGNTDPSGHVDFYANDGLAPQPGCRGRESLDLLCSHLRAWKIYEDSIEGSEFYAIQCPTFQEFESRSCCENQVVLLGDQTLNNTRGIFYFYTNSVKPFVKARKLSINCYS